MKEVKIVKDSKESRTHHLIPIYHKDIPVALAASHSWDFDHGDNKIFVYPIISLSDSENYVEKKYYVMPYGGIQIGATYDTGKYLSRYMLDKLSDIKVEYTEWDKDTTTIKIIFDNIRQMIINGVQPYFTTVDYFATNVIQNKGEKEVFHMHMSTYRYNMNLSDHERDDNLIEAFIGSVHDNQYWVSLGEIYIDKLIIDEKGAPLKFGKKYNKIVV